MAWCGQIACGLWERHGEALHLFPRELLTVRIVKNTSMIAGTKAAVGTVGDTFTGVLESRFTRSNAGQKIERLVAFPSKSVARLSTGNKVHSNQELIKSATLPPVPRVALLPADGAKRSEVSARSCTKATPQTRPSCSPRNHLGLHSGNVSAHIPGGRGFEFRVIGVDFGVFGGVSA